MTIVIGSKQFNNKYIDELIDSFDNIIRCNISLPGNNNGTKKSTIQYLNNHVYDNIYAKQKTLEQNLCQYKEIATAKSIIEFSEYIKKTKFDIVYRQQDLKKILSNFKKINCPINIEKKPTTGLESILQQVVNNNYVYVSHFSINNTNYFSYYALQKINEKIHNFDNEIEILKWLHNNNKIDMTFSCLDIDYELPKINCLYMKPTVQSINKILNIYGICILTNYFDHNILNNIKNEVINIFKNIDKIDDLYVEQSIKEEMSNDKRIFNVQNYSKLINDVFNNNKFFLNIAKIYTNKDLTKRRSLINHVYYEKNKKNNSGAGWHRDNHNMQFKIIMYLNNVNLNNGCFQFIPKSSKKYMGIPPSRTKNYNTRYTDDTINSLLKKYNTNIMNIEGKCGTIIIVDTTYIHRGNILKLGERYAITEYFFP